MKPAFFKNYVFVLFFAAISIFASLFLWRILGINTDLSISMGTFRKVLFFKYYITELLVVLALVMLAYSNTRISGFMKKSVLPMIVLVWAFQFASFWLSNEYLSLLILENIGAVTAIISVDVVLILASFLCLAMLVIIILRFSAKLLVPKTHKLRVILVLTGLCLSLFVIDNNLSREHKENTREITRKLVNGRSPPLYAGLMLVRDHFTPVQHLGYDAYSLSNSLTAREFDIRVRWNADFPMVHKKFYETDFPFKRIKPIDRPNVIVFFVEALSARKLSMYGSPFENISPNLERISKNTLIVDNYYSHTQSTFRGIRGQLCSMFPLHTTRTDQWADASFIPPQTTYDCIPHHLGNRGYDTIFLGPDDPEHMHFLHQTRSMGFNHNLYRQNLKQSYLNDEPYYGYFLTDVQMMKALNGIIEKPLSSKPFFITGYFKSSHVGHDIWADGTSYGSGKNRVLNTIHTFDVAFGSTLWGFSSIALFIFSLKDLTSRTPPVWDSRLCWPSCLSCPIAQIRS
jgi:hypothetical protein